MGFESMWPKNHTAQGAGRARAPCAHGGALSGGAGREVVLGGVACVNVWIVSVASGVVCASALVSGVRARVCVCVRQLQSAFTVCPSASVSVYSGTCVRLRVSLACQEPFNFREWRPSRFRLLSRARPPCEPSVTCTEANGMRSRKAPTLLVFYCADWR